MFKVGDVISVVGLVLTVIVIPLLVWIFRQTNRWNRMEFQLTRLVTDVQKHVDKQDQIHAEMIRTMGDDRKATDERLKFLERFVWREQYRRKEE